MIYIGYLDGTPYNSRVSHCSTGGAESWASRNIGSHWRKYYKVCYDPQYKHWQEEQAKSAPRKWLDRLCDWAKLKATMLGDMQLKEYFGVKAQYFWGKYCVSRTEWRQLHGWER